MKYYNNCLYCSYCTLENNVFNTIRIGCSLNNQCEINCSKFKLSTTIKLKKVLIKIKRYYIKKIYPERLFI